jgi:DNA-binding NtrC family response regulator
MESQSPPQPESTHWLTEGAQEADRDLFYWRVAAGEFRPPRWLEGLDCERIKPGDAVAASEALRHSNSAVMLVEFPEGNGAQLLDQVERLIGEYRHCAWIALLPQQWQRQDRLCTLITRAFYDYHILPPEVERLRIIIGHAFGMLALQRRVEQLAPPRGELAELIGDSPVMERLKKQLHKVAEAPGTVLIHGESGTGKELAARAVHLLSMRKNGPFEALNCAALPPSLIQAELFGHEKGAFTDAHQSKIGRFEAADGGTLFLDEIGDMPAELQVNLLRVLEQQSLRRVGGSRDIPIDVRVIAATHIDLEQAVRQQQFREDLFYRLNVLKLHMPPLRERGDDIELLARYFFKRFSEPSRFGPKGLSQEAIDAMSNHTWPGNVRELINKIQHAIVMADGPLIRPHDLGIERRESRRRRITLESARHEAECRAINDALHIHRHNVTEAARELSISRVTLYRLMEKHRIPPR